MTELKPCPFCGRTPIVDDCGDNRYFVKCKCGIVQDKLYAQKCDAVRRWNTRKTGKIAKDTNVPSNDCIDRQAAIDAIVKYVADGYAESPNDFEGYMEIVKKLPSAQPEPLTDKEQRIFLSAMGREEEVCKEVDDAWRDCREPYEDSLVHVCREIKRKVKGALWT